MIGIVVATHGAMSEALLTSLEMIMGPFKCIHSVVFKEEDSIESLRDAVTKLYRLYKNDGCIFLTDIMGGSATNICTEFLKYDNVEVVAGVSLPMLFEVVASRESGTLRSLADRAKEAGKRSVVNVREFMESKRAASKK
ncbi:MAG: PTS sugar transporter subunit IIA [Candidatus Riflebacteria bacterium]|nr:PTS sugar transporter subunit IIA [Candidatus Riflebacteria bacterium]